MTGHSGGKGHKGSSSKNHHKSASTDRSTDRSKLKSTSSASCKSKTASSTAASDDRKRKHRHTGDSAEENADPSDKLAKKHKSSDKSKRQSNTNFDNKKHKRKHSDSDDLARYAHKGDHHDSKKSTTKHHKSSKSVEATNSTKHRPTKSVSQQSKAEQPKSKTHNKTRPETQSKRRKSSQEEAESQSASSSDDFEPKEDSDSDSPLDSSTRNNGGTNVIPLSNQRTITLDSSAWKCIICTYSWESVGPHKLCVLQCGHLFGKCCIVKWIRANRNCPQCKRSHKTNQIIELFAQNSLPIVAMPAENTWRPGPIRTVLQSRSVNTQFAPLSRPQPQSLARPTCAAESRTVDDQESASLALPQRHESAPTELQPSPALASESSFYFSPLPDSAFLETDLSHLDVSVPSVICNGTESAAGTLVAVDGAGFIPPQCELKLTDCAPDFGADSGVAASMPPLESFSYQESLLSLQQQRRQQDQQQPQQQTPTCAAERPALSLAPFTASNSPPVLPASGQPAAERSSAVALPDLVASAPAAPASTTAPTPADSLPLPFAATRPMAVRAFGPVPAGPYVRKHATKINRFLTRQC